MQLREAASCRQMHVFAGGFSIRFHGFSICSRVRSSLLLVSCIALRALSFLVNNRPLSIRKPIEKRVPALQCTVGWLLDPALSLGALPGLASFPPCTEAYLRWHSWLLGVVILKLLATHSAGSPPRVAL